MKRILCSLSLAMLAALPVYADANGDLWKVTSQMTMEGMPPGMGMGAQTRQVCSAREWTKPPVASEERGCKTTDFLTTGNKVTWKMTCPDMSGSGEITRSSPNAYTGWMKMTMAQGTMTMNLSGERIGDCDAGEAKKEREAQVARVQQQAAQAEQQVDIAKDQTCRGVAESADLQMFNMQTQTGTCTDPKYKVLFCESLKKCDRYKQLREREKAQPEYGLNAVAKFCGADVAKLITVCCDDAVENNDVKFVTANCPAQAKTMALEKCAGMGYSALQSEPWLSFCTTYAKDVMGKGVNADPKKKRDGKSSR